MQRTKLCNKCSYVSPPEAEGVKKQSAKHMCLKYGTEVFHNGFEPYIFRIPGCLYYKKREEGKEC